MLADTLDTVVAFPVGWGSLVALVIPVVTAAVTKFREGNSKVHAVVALVLAGVVAVLQMLTDDVPNDTWQSVFATFLAVVVPAVVSYIAVWQPVADVNKTIAPNKGI